MKLHSRQKSLVRLPQPISLKMAHGSPSTAGPITNETSPVQLHLGEHIQSTSFLVTKTVHLLILGHTWLHQHSPEIVCVSYSVKFSTFYCKKHCVFRSTTVVGFPTRRSGPVGEDYEQVSAHDTLVDGEGIQSRLDHNTVECLQVSTLDWGNSTCGSIPSAAGTLSVVEEQQAKSDDCNLSGLTTSWSPCLGINSSQPEVAPKHPSLLKIFHTSSVRLMLTCCRIIWFWTKLLKFCFDLDFPRLWKSTMFFTRLSWNPLFQIFSLIVLLLRRLLSRLMVKKNMKSKKSWTLDFFLRSILVQAEGLPAVWSYLGALWKCR